MKALTGLDIIITRPQAQARRWQHQLQSLGANTQLIPVMQIVPVQSANEQEAIRNTAAHLPHYQKIIFISQNAVSAAQSFFSTLPANADIFAIGSSTAASLAEWGVQAQAAQQAMNSETLLALAALQKNGVQGQRVLICRGVGGRTVLGDTLRERGARVDYCELYHRQRDPNAAASLANLVRCTSNQQMVEVVSIHSGESLSFLLETMSDIGEAALPLYTAPLLVPGERVADIARKNGFNNIICSVNASDETMTQTLVHWWHENGRSQRGKS